MDHTEEDEADDEKTKETKGVMEIIIRKLEWDNVRREHNLDKIVQEAKKRARSLSELPTNREMDILRRSCLTLTKTFEPHDRYKGKMVARARSQVEYWRKRGLA